MFDILLFWAGFFLGGLALNFYFQKEDCGQNNLTIEAIVHELKTPLTGLGWIFDSLSEIKAGEALGQESVGLIREGKEKAGNALALANDALAAINTSIGHVSYKFENGNLVDVIRKVIEENGLIAKEKSIEIKFDFFPDIPAFSFDVIKITLALRNLINNAVKYTPAGGQVSVNLHKDADQAVITVADTGIGIPEADMGKIFGKFFRAGNIGEATGSGLGLFIVKNVIAGHGGRIDIQSKEGKGTKVTIFLPIK